MRGFVRGLRPKVRIRRNLVTTPVYIWPPPPRGAQMIRWEDPAPRADHGLNHTRLPGDLRRHHRTPRFPPALWFGTCWYRSTVGSA